MFVYTGDAWDAAKAKATGMVSEVVPPEELEARAFALADKLAAGPTVAIGLAKQLLENARIAGTWPYIALVQGLFEDDTFRRERQALPEVPDDLALLALVKWS